ALSGVIATDSMPLLHALLAMLGRHRIAWREDGGWRLADGSGLPEPATIWRSLVEEEPALTGELALAATISGALPSILRQGLAAAPELAVDLLEQFLFDSPSGRRVLGALCRAVREIAEAWPTSRPLRILEIGAGSGV